MSKTEYEKVCEQRAVSDDMSEANAAIWLRPGGWYAFVMADPIYYGKLIAITPTHYYLEDASWISDAGRASEFVKNPHGCHGSEFLGEIAIARPEVAVYRVGGKREKIPTTNAR